MLIVKSLYGLQSLAKLWRTHFALTLQSMGFISSRADQDVWLCNRDDDSGYDYICTHVDDFSIFAKDLELICWLSRTYTWCMPLDRQNIIWAPISSATTLVKRTWVLQPMSLK
jgi:hypothetical protein